jgi:ribose transport system substrate-binding protein
MKRLLLLAVGTAIVLAAVWGWFRQAERPLKPVWYIPKTIDTSIEFWQVVKEGVAAASQEYGLNYSTYGTDTESDVDGQIRILEQAIAAKPAVVLLAATDYERIVPVAKRIVQAGIPLITLDSGLQGDVAASLIATDNYTAGAKAGEALEKVIANQGDVALVSFIQGSFPAIERENGVRDQLQKAPGIHIVGTYYCDGSESRAYDITKRLLQENPHLQGIVGLNEPSATGAAKAVKDAGLGIRVKLVGFDNATDEVSLLDDGVIQALVVQKPFNMGYLAAKAAVQIERGQKLEPRIDTGSEVIWKDTMYDKSNQKLLFPFVGSPAQAGTGAGR